MIKRIDFNELKKEIKERVNLHEIHNRYASGLTPLKGSNSVYSIYTCPECNCNKLTVYPNGAMCYSCSPGTMDIFDYYMFLTKTNSFSSSVLTIALDEGFITQEDYDRITKSKKYSGKSYINVNQNKIQSKPKVEKINLDAQLKSPEFIDMVYDAITELFPLTKEQYLCLKANRALALKRIREDYFNIPKVTKHFIRDLLNYINEKYNVNYIATDLLGVPGFYVENGEVTFVKRSGLGIKMKNAQGQIVGLQVRRYDYIKDNKMVIVEKEGDNAGKYYWIASPGLEKGCSAGSPLDVLYPLNIEDMYNAVIITEGKFKEEMLIQYFNHATISVQGVSSWKNKIYKEIKSISENYIDIKEAYIAYDADMATNVKVYNQCKKMVEHELLPNNISAQMLIWDYRDGKGIDDLIINNKINTIKKVSFCDYVTEYEKFISKMRELYPKSKQELFLKDDGKTFVEDDIIEKYYREIVFNKLMKSHI